MPVTARGSNPPSSSVAMNAARMWVEPEDVLVRVNWLIGLWKESR